MTKKELKAKLSDIIDRKRKIRVRITTIDPIAIQGREMAARVAAEKAAFDAVLDALNNDDAMLIVIDRGE